MKPIHIVLRKPFEKVGMCASRFFGNPDLPKRYDFPCYTDSEGEEYEYTFVCQINLADIAPYDAEGRLPHRGLLSFFAKIDHYLGYYGCDSIGGAISDADDVKVLYFPECEDFEELVLVDENDEPVAPAEFELTFSDEPSKECEYPDEHMLFAPPTHREWETWDPPYEDWEILLQIDSFDGMDFNLNFMDFGVFDFLISPEDLRNGRFDNVRGIVLST